MKLRQGRRVARHLYLQRGDTPQDTDPPVGMVDTPELAKLIVERFNLGECRGDNEFAKHEREQWVAIIHKWALTMQMSDTIRLQFVAKAIEENEREPWVPRPLPKWMGD